MAAEASESELADGQAHIMDIVNKVTPADSPGMTVLESPSLETLLASFNWLLRALVLAGGAMGLALVVKDSLSLANGSKQAGSRLGAWFALFAGPLVIVAIDSLFE